MNREVFERARFGFRLSADDNIVFLQDIAENRPRSLFDNAYLALFRRAHEECGAKVVLNLFYDNSSSAGFGKKREYFDLSMMPGGYKGEWRENADWLKLSFHALREYPPDPYAAADGAAVLADAEKVNGEIARFAGESSLASFATVHFGKIADEGLDALKKAGYKGFAGYFDVTENGPAVAYGRDEAFCRRIGAEKFAEDRGTAFAKIDLCMNLAPTAAENLAKLNGIIKRSGGKFVHIMIHEQYFYRDYAAHIKEYGEIVLGCCARLKQCGYKGRFYSELCGDFV